MSRRSALVLGLLVGGCWNDPPPQPACFGGALALDGGTSSGLVATAGGGVTLAADQDAGSYDSPIFALHGTSISQLVWTPQQPFGLPLPDHGGADPTFRTGGVSMEGNVLLLHLDQASPVGFADTSDHGHHARCQSVCPRLGEGRYHSAAVLTGNGDGLLVRDDGSDVELHPAHLTVEAWGMVTGPPITPDDHRMVLLSKGYSLAGMNSIDFSLEWATTQRVNCNAVVNGGGAYGNVTVPMNKWFHAACTFDGKDLQLYVNGIRDAVDHVDPSGNGILYYQSEEHDVQIGYWGPRNGPMARRFVGAIDEVALYQRALSEDEIRAHYVRGSAHIGFQVRSCGDSACSAMPSFVGPSNTPETRFGEGCGADSLGVRRSLPLARLPCDGVSPPGGSPLPQGPYLQLRALLGANRVDDLVPPELESVQLCP